MASAVDVGNENTSTKFQARANTSVKGDLVVPTSQPNFKEKESNLERMLNRMIMSDYYSKSTLL